MPAWTWTDPIDEALVNALAGAGDPTLMVDLAREYAAALRERMLDPAGGVVYLTPTAADVCPRYRGGSTLGPGAPGAPSVGPRHRSFWSNFIKYYLYITAKAYTAGIPASITHTGDTNQEPEITIASYKPPYFPPPYGLPQRTPLEIWRFNTTILSPEGNPIPVGTVARFIWKGAQKELYGCEWVSKVTGLPAHPYNAASAADDLQHSGKLFVFNGATWDPAPTDRNYPDIKTLYWPIAMNVETSVLGSGDWLFSGHPGAFNPDGSSAYQLLGGHSTVDLFPPRLGDLFDVPLLEAIRLAINMMTKRFAMSDPFSPGLQTITWGNFAVSIKKFRAVTTLPPPYTMYQTDFELLDTIPGVPGGSLSYTQGPSYLDRFAFELDFEVDGGFTYLAA